MSMETTPGHSKLPFVAKEIDTIRGLCETMGLDAVEPFRNKQGIISNMPPVKDAISLAMVTLMILIHERADCCILHICPLVGLARLKKRSSLTNYSLDQGLPAVRVSPSQRIGVATSGTQFPSTTTNELPSANAVK
ncbi:hypothetical protein BKA56DRAFT_622626 [Ilyonectria sp. MPI-CAGE-AT-0026]|nr:hypothetical protein BKA56DRAFT_622626 [Ilyonectria sp. MPI-CAGE-AT-0026]